MLRRFHLRHVAQPAHRTQAIDFALYFLISTGRERLPITSDTAPQSASHNLVIRHRSGAPRRPSPGLSLEWRTGAHSGGLPGRPVALADLQQTCCRRPSAAWGKLIHGRLVLTRLPGTVLRPDALADTAGTRRKPVERPAQRQRSFGCPRPATFLPATIRPPSGAGVSYGRAQRLLRWPHSCTPSPFTS